MCVPANPVDTGQAERQGAVYVWEATVRAAQERLDRTLEILRGEGLAADGELGDYRPLVALDQAVKTFRPDRLVICTHPGDGRPGCATTWSSGRRGVSVAACHPRHRGVRPARRVVVRPPTPQAVA